MARQQYHNKKKLSSANLLFSTSELAYHLKIARKLRGKKMDNINFRASKHTIRQLEKLEKQTGMNRSQVIILAIERLAIGYNREILDLYPNTNAIVIAEIINEK